MRLQVGPLGLAIFIGALGTFSATSASAEGRGAVWTSYFSSSDGLTVLSPQVSARASILDWLALDASYEADIITAASVDLVSAASPRGYTEERHGLGAGMTLRPLTATELSVHYTPSFEPDFVSHSGVFSAEREWIDRRLTTQASYRFGVDRVGRRGEAASTWRDVSSHSLSLGLGWVFSRRMVGDVAYEVQVHEGFLASPYRFVRFYREGSMLPMGAPESVPDERVRHAISLGIRRAFVGNWFGKVRMRLYADSWGIKSFSNEMEVQRAFWGSRLLVGLSGRLYEQTSASFHAYRYELKTDGLPTFRDADKMLSSSFSLLLGPRVEAHFGRLGPFSDVQATAMVELYSQHFFDFAPLSERYATITSFGLSAEYWP